MLQEGCGEDVLSRALTAYEEALTLQSSMQTFAKCLGARIPPIRPRPRR